MHTLERIMSICDPIEQFPGSRKAQAMEPAPWLLAFNSDDDDDVFEDDEDDFEDDDDDFEDDDDEYFDDDEDEDLLEDDDFDE